MRSIVVGRIMLSLSGLFHTVLIPGTYSLIEMRFLATSPIALTAVERSPR